MSDSKQIVPSGIQSLVDDFFAKNRALYGDLRMEATDSGEDQSGSGDDTDDKDDKAGETPKPSDTVDYWKRRARDNEKRAKDNADKAKRLDEIEEAKKTEDEKRADADAKQKQETENLRLENMRLRAAGANSISGEDEDGVEYADLIGGSDEESITRNAKSIGRLLAAAKERDDLKNRYEKGGRPTTGRPTGNLRPGSLPPGEDLQRGGGGGITEAERRFGKQDSK